MLQSLKQAFAIDSNHPELHENLIDYLYLCKNIYLFYLLHYMCFIVKNNQISFAEPVRVVIDASLPHMTQEKTLEELNQDFIGKYKDTSSIEHMISG